MTLDYLDLLTMNLFIGRIIELSLFTTIWISVCAVLSLLFWLLAIQNPAEKNLRLIALVTTFSTLTVFFNTIQDNIRIILYNGLPSKGITGNIFGYLHLYIDGSHNGKYFQKSIYPGTEDYSDYLFYFSNDFIVFPANIG